MDSSDRDRTDVDLCVEEGGGGVNRSHIDLEYKHHPISQCKSWTRLLYSTVPECYTAVADRLREDDLFGTDLCPIELDSDGGQDVSRQGV